MEGRNTLNLNHKLSGYSSISSTGGETSPINTTISYYSAAWTYKGGFYEIVSGFSCMGDGDVSGMEVFTDGGVNVL